MKFIASFLYSLFFLTAYAIAAEPINIHYYGHEYQTCSGWTDAVEKIAASSDSIKLLQVATDITYTNGAKFIINPPEDLTIEELNNTTDYEFDERIEVIEYGKSFILPTKRRDFNLFSGGLEKIAELLNTDFIPAELFYGTTPSGIRFQVVYIPSKQERNLWYSTYKLDHQLSIGTEKVMFTTLSDPSGLDTPTVDMVEEASQKSSNILLSIGAAHNMPEGLDRTLRFISSADTDIVALNSEDIYNFYTAADKSKLKIGLSDPDYICSNIDVKNTKLERIIKPYAFRRFGRKTIAFVAFMPILHETTQKLSGNGISYFDPKNIEKTEAFLKDLRSKTGANLVVAVSFFPKNDSGWLNSVHGINIVIGPKDWNERIPVKTRLEFSGRENTDSNTPSIIVFPDDKGAGKIICELSRSGKLEAVESVAGSEDKSMPYKPEIRNAMKQDIINGMLTGLPLLPDPRNLSINNNPPHPFYFLPDFYNAAVSILRKEYKTEVSILKMHANSTNVLGDVPSAVVNIWLGQDEPLLIAYVTGSYIKKILSKRPTAANINNYSASNYMGKEYYVVSGTDDSGKISGLPIQNNEIYTAVIPVSLVNSDKNTKVIKNLGVSLHSVINNKLTQIREKYTQRSQWEQAIQAEAKNFTPLRNIWRLNLSNLSLYVSKLGVGGRSSGYAAAGESRLSAVNQTNIRGSANIISEFYADNFRMNLGVTANYGKVVLSSYTAENVDSLTYSGELRYKWKNYNGKLGSIVLGPFASAEWETEFTKNDNAHLRRVLRSKAGLKLFEGAALKELYIGLTTQQDYTNSPYYTQYAAETGYKISYPIPNTDFTLNSNGSYRRFARSSNDTVSDLLDRLEVNSKLTTKLYKNITLDIFANYLYATGKKLNKNGSSLETGFSVSFTMLFKLKK